MLPAMLYTFQLPGETSPVCSVHFEDEYRQHSRSVKDPSGATVSKAAGRVRSATPRDGGSLEGGSGCNSGLPSPCGSREAGNSIDSDKPGAPRRDS